MTQKDIALYYEQLTRGEKGRFTAFISLRLGAHVTSHHQGTVQYHREQLLENGICGMILFPMNSFCYD